MKGFRGRAKFADYWLTKKAQPGFAILKANFGFFSFIFKRVRFFLEKGGFPAPNLDPPFLGFFILSVISKGVA